LPIIEHNKITVQQQEEIEAFREHLSEIINQLEEAGLNYRVVGSIGVAAHILSAQKGIAFLPRHPDGSPRDIDILILEPPTKEILRKTENLLAFFGAHARSESSYPEVSLVLPAPKNSLTMTGKDARAWILPTSTSVLAVDEAGNFFKVYNSLSLLLNENMLLPITVELMGVKFPTLSPGVLAGLYLIRRAGFEFHDLEKIKMLAQLPHFKIPKEFCDFARKIRETYPKQYRNFLIRSFLWYLFRG